MQKAYFFDLLSDLFNFYSIDQAYKRLLRLIDEDLYKLFPKQLAEYKALEPRIKEKIVEVSQRFRNQYTRLIHESEDYVTNQELQERIRSGAVYFHKELEPVRALYNKTNMPLDNKELRKLLAERMQALDDALWIKESLLEAVSARERFAITDYLKLKAKVMLSLEDDSSSSGSSKALKEKKERKERKERTRSGAEKVKVEVPTDILHPGLYRALAEWRTAKTREVNLPAYVIMQQKALMGIVNLLPDNPRALEAIPYFGAKGVEKYGLEILGIVRKYMAENQLERPEIMDMLISDNREAASRREELKQRKEEQKQRKEEEKQKKEAEKQKKEAEKEKKKDTKLVSYEMFCQGMSIDEIAKARELVSGTIAGHLEYYVRLGKIKVEKVVKAENLAKIRKHLEEHEYMGIFAIKAALGDDVSYADIKFVLAVSGH